MLWGCKNEAEAEGKKNTQPTQKRIKTNLKIKDIIALNEQSCLLSAVGEVYCWKVLNNGSVDLGSLKKVDLAGAKARSIYGGSGDTHYFETGYHGCALLTNNNIRCWGKIDDDTVFDANKIFDLKSSKDVGGGEIKSFGLKTSIFQQAGKIKRLITSHSVVCVIDDKNKLFCPHSHLSFLNGTEEVRTAIFGEVLSCIQTLEKELECYDMRNGSNNSPIFINLDGESWPKDFAFRFVYAAGITFISDSGAVMYWEGRVPKWDKFPGVYGIEGTNVAMGANAKAEAVYMSENSACLRLNDGSATCWGAPVKGKGDDFAPPGERISFGKKGKVIDIALGISHNCFLLSNSNIECFVNP